jgi:hypothetical protein
LKRTVGNEDPVTAARKRTVVTGERKAASRCRLRTGKKAEVLVK